MSLNLGTAYVRLELRKGEYDKDIRTAANSMDFFSRTARIAAGIMARDLFYAVSDAANEIIRMGASFETVKNAFDAMARVEGRQVLTLQDLTRATGGMVSQLDLATQAANALTLGLEPDTLEEWFHIASVLGPATGKTVTEALDAITIGLGRLSWRQLDNIGIVLRQSTANKEYADSLGRTVDSLSAAERRQAFWDYALERGRELVSGLEGTISSSEKSLNRWSAAVKDAETALGRLISPLTAVLPLIQSLTPAIALAGVQAMATWGSTISTKLTPALLGLKGALTAVASAVGLSLGPFLVIAALLGLTLPTAIKGVKKLLKDLDIAIGVNTRANWELEDALHAVEDSLDDVADAAQEADDASTAYTTALEAQEQAQEEVSDAIDDYLSAIDRVGDMEFRRVDLLNDIDDSLIRVERAQDNYNDSVRRAEQAEKDFNRAIERRNRLENDLARATSNLSGFVSHLTGAVGGYTIASEDATWATEEARRAYDDLSAKLSTLQEGYDATAAAAQGFRGEIDEDRDQISIYRLEIAKIQREIDKSVGPYEKREKAIQDEIDALKQLERERGLTPKERKRLEITLPEQLERVREKMVGSPEQLARIKELEGLIADLQISIMEAEIQLDDANEALDEQGRTLSEASDEMDTLIELNEDAISTTNDLETATNNLVEAEERLSEAREGVEDALIGIGDATRGVEKARRALSEFDEDFAAAERSVTQAEEDLRTALQGSITETNDLVAAREALADASRAAKQAEDELREALLRRKELEEELPEEPPIPGLPGENFPTMPPWDEGPWGRGGPPVVPQSGQSFGEGYTFNFNIGTFVGLNRDSAKVLAQATAKEHMKELNRLGVATP